jgi:hypothetical protein
MRCWVFERGRESTLALYARLLRHRDRQDLCSQGIRILVTFKAAGHALLPGEWTPIIGCCMYARVANIQEQSL